MKKCPMMFNREVELYIHGDKTYEKIIPTYSDCIGSECAAYVERPRVEHSLLGHPKQWSCAMVPREVWINVDDVDKNHDL